MKAIAFDLLRAAVCIVGGLAVVTIGLRVGAWL